MSRQTLIGIELVLWSAPTDWAPVPVSRVRDCLSDRAFDRDFAPQVAISTAFRRAIKTQETDGLKTTVGGRLRLAAQLDAIEEHADRIDRRHIRFWTCDKDTGRYDGPTIPMEECRETYQLADVSKVFQAILKRDGLGSYSLRKGGGIYAVPTGAADFLSRLEALADSLGLRFLRYEIPDTSAQRSEISETIARDLNSELEGHSSALASYDTETKAGVIRNRREGIACSRALIGRLAPYLLPTDYALLSQALTDLDTVCGAAERSAAARNTTTRQLAIGD